MAVHFGVSLIDPAFVLCGCEAVPFALLTTEVLGVSCQTCQAALEAVRLERVA